MTSTKDGKGRFITTYVNWLNDASTIRAVLKEKQMGYRKKPSNYRKNQINVLQNRLAEMQETSQQDSENQPLINAAAETFHDTTAALLETEENALDFNQNQLTYPEQSSQNNSYHFQQSIETFGDDLFSFDNDLEDYTSYDMLEPISPLTESNTSSTTISRSNREQEIELLNPILSLNAMESNKIDDLLISNFKSALPRQKSYVIKAMWDGNPLLRAWYSGQPVNFGNNQSQQPDMRAISLDDLISSFKSALSNQTAYVIKAMWDGNPLLQAWYSGQPVNFGNNQSQQPDMRVISLDDLISNFKSTLSSRTAYVIKAMWDGNPLLRAWYSGQPVNFGNNQSQQPDMRVHLPR